MAIRGSTLTRNYMVTGGSLEHVPVDLVEFSADPPVQAGEVEHVPVAATSAALEHPLATSDLQEP